MDLNESLSSPKGRGSSLTNLKKYLSLYSDPCSPTDENPFPLQSFHKTMPTTLESLKEDITDINSKSQSFSAELSSSIFLKFKRQNFLLKQENQNLLKEIQILNKTLKAKNEELRKNTAENSKMKKIVAYVIEEILGEKDLELDQDILPFLVKKVNFIKNTVVNTQKAFFRQKEINKKVRIENNRLQAENVSNIELILKLNSYRDKVAESSRFFDGALESFEKVERTEKKHTRHKKSNSLYFDTAVKKTNEFFERDGLSPTSLYGNL
jgi:hypothetical protein